VVTGCWATSDPTAAAAIDGVDALIDNKQDLSSRLSQLLDAWTGGGASHAINSTTAAASGSRVDAIPLPQLHERQSANQRAFLKVQDGCDAFCTYCIIPQLRPVLWSKPIDECVTEARALVDAGHVELVLTGIFLGAYGYPTALRRRQERPQVGRADRGSLAHLVEALCTRVDGLKRLRLSSLEPGDLDEHLIGVLKEHEQAVPHFHLPLQSGSDAILKRMNRQYRRDDFLRMIDAVNAAFDRPAITTDIIVGFPGETDDEFEQTLHVCRRSRFIHTHAFSYSPRPKTAAARWTAHFVENSVANGRIEQLTRLSAVASAEFRSRFVGQAVNILVERDKPGATIRHGRCERYFDVQFASSPDTKTGDDVTLRIERIDGPHTFGHML